MTAFLFDVDLSIEAPKQPEPPPASAEYLVVGGDSSEIIVYSIGGDTLDEVSRLSVAPRNRVLGLQFSPDGKTLWIAARASSGSVLYLASAKFSAGVLSEYTEHQTIGTQFQQHVSMSVSGSRLAVLGMDNARLRLFDVSGSPSEIADIATGGDPRFLTFCGASDQYIAYTTGNGGTLELVDANDLTALDSYAGRSSDVAAHRGTDVIFATSAFSDLDVLSVSGGTISLLAAGPNAGSGSLVWLPNRGELWSGEVLAPWDGSAWGANVQTAIGANKIIAAGPSEQRIAAAWPTTNSPGIVLYRTDDPETVADSLSEVESLAGRALAITGSGGASELTKAELAPPIIDDISPKEGPASGGTLVGIRGARFRDGARVFFGDTESESVTLISQIKINAVTPAEDEGLADVTVINPDGQEATLANGFEFTAPVTTLTVTSINPATGPEAGGTAVTITGTGFVTGATVTIGGSAATSVVVVNSTTITCDTPAGTAGNADVVVINPDTESATLIDGFEYTASASTFNDVVAAQAPLLWYRLDETTGTTAADSSGNSYDGTYSADASGGTVSPPSGSDGLGGGIAFSASGVQRVLSPSNSALAVGTVATGAWSIVIYLTGGSASNAYIFNRQNSCAVIYRYAGENIELFANNYSGDNPRTGSSISLPAAQTAVSQIAYTYDNGTLKGFKDGVQVFSRSASFALNSSTPQWAVARTVSNINQAENTIFDVQLYNRALTAAELSEQWDARDLA